jgi:hypothetical protein
MWQIVSQRPVPKKKQTDYSSGQYQKWPNGMSQELWESQFPEGNSGYGVKDLHQKYVGNKDNSMLKSTRTPFYIGVVDLDSGEVIHTVPHHKAEAAGFHHTHYLPHYYDGDFKEGDRDIKREVDDRTAAIFWMGTRPSHKSPQPTSWVRLPTHIKRSINDQVWDMNYESRPKETTPKFDPPRPPRSWSRAGSWKTIERV